MTKNAQNNSNTELRSLRILFEKNNKNYSLCKFLFTHVDSSIYLFPYSINRKYYVGKQNLSREQYSKTFNFKEDSRFDENVPKISIHESGLVHIEVNQEKLGPSKIGKISKLRGEHIASVIPENMNSLPIHLKIPKKDGPNIDLVCPIPDQLNNARLAIYANGLEPKFACGKCPIVINIDRITLSRRLYLGLNLFPEIEFNKSSKTGNKVICGWDPKLSHTEEQDFFFVRGA